MTLTQGTTYRAYLSLPFLMPQGIGEGIARGKLQDAGFADVIFYDANGRTVVQGRWTGATQDIDLKTVAPQLSDVSAVTP